MPEKIVPLDYSLIGPESQLAELRGLVSSQWYSCSVPRSRLKELMQRRNGPAIRDTLIWLALLTITSTAAYYLRRTWWSFPAFAAYAVFLLLCIRFSLA